MITQLTLPLEAHGIFTLENFDVGVNEDLFPHLFGSDNLWLYGDSAVGKTHAVHILVAELEHAVLVSDSDYELIGLEAFGTVVLDRIEQWIGNENKEKSVFGLYEQLMRARHRLILISRSNVEALSFALPDLKSRVSMFSRYLMLPLPSSKQLIFLQGLVARTGASLSVEVAKFILRHLTRSQAGLVSAIARLNQESIARNRHISVPLVKEVFGL